MFAFLVFLFLNNSAFIVDFFFSRELIFGKPTTVIFEMKQLIMYAC